MVQAQLVTCLRWCCADVYATPQLTLYTCRANYLIVLAPPKCCLTESSDRPGACKVIVLESPDCLSENSHNTNDDMSQVALQLECQQGTSAKAELLHKWDMITSFQDQNAAMDALIKRLFKHNMVNKQQWEEAAAEAKQFLSEQIVPALGQVSKEAHIMNDWMMREQAAFAQVQLHQLPTYCAQGEVLAS